MTGIVYFIKAGDAEGAPIKIGFTSGTVERRVGYIQHACPWPIVILGTVRGERRHEAWLHRLLLSHRTSGEWFAPTEQVLEVVKQALEPGWVWPSTLVVPKVEKISAPKRSHDSAVMERVKSARGGTVELAKALGSITSQAISQWRKIPANRARDVARVTGISVHELRPDIFGPAPEPARAAS